VEIVAARTVRGWEMFRRRPLAQQLLAALLAVAVVGGIAAAVAVTRPPAVAEQAYRIPVTDGPRHDQHIRLDSTLYVPAGADAGHRVPAVILAHGFGGSKDSVAGDARELARHGYVVLAYTARGFGGSDGQIALDSPDYEVADARQLVDWLATRPQVRLDGPGDPRVGVTGGSYGGALALMLAGYDPRVDAIVPLVTWNDLGRAFFPDAAAPAGEPASTDGVFKRLWAGLLFSAGSGPADAGTGPGADAGTDPGTDAGTDPGTDPGDPATAGGAGPAAGAFNPCGAFTLQLCRAYAETARTGRPTPALLALLRRSSPAPVLDRIAAPTLLIQGETDTLFPLSEADANARGIAANGTPVKMYWYAGGHDAGGDLAQTDRQRSLVTGWFDHWLAGGPDPGTRFEYTRISPPRSSDSSAPRTRTVVAPAYPADPRRQPVPLSGRPQQVLSPPGGNPAAISALPGLGDLPALAASGLGSDIRGQFAAFSSAPLGSAVEVVGSSTVDIQVASSAPEAVLFAKLYDVDTAGRADLPRRLVAPLRVTGLRPEVPVTVHVTLPAVVHRFDVGHRMRLVLSTTDQAYAGPADPATYRISLAAAPALAVPLVPGTPRQTGPSPVWWLAAGMVVIAVAAFVGWRVTRRMRARGVVRALPELAGVPLVVEDLVKVFRGGLVAVDGLTFRVERGQVCGLLGPNGAGKTTTLRVLMGLIHPTSGLVRVFGEAITPGAAVLARVGAFVEGPGFLPHLSGMDNLTLYWRATGRPMAQARMAETLAIAGLGDAVHRTVRSYSHGMKQRLAIAQAMLGFPDLLVLDEPTNGLDPPQIRAMREVLRRYAAPDNGAGGRTVLVSSHLLAEIEQTCTHVVVMNNGRLVAAGEVAELAGAGRLEDAFLRMLEYAGDAARLPAAGSGPATYADGAARQPAAGSSPERYAGGAARLPAAGSGPERYAGGAARQPAAGSGPGRYAGGAARLPAAGSGPERHIAASEE
jgi:ABC-2 type transport system ATP-binding protein